MKIKESNEPFETINKQLGKGWMCGLISHPNENLFRLQLMDTGEEETGWRKCIVASTLDDAISKAIKFTNSTSVEEYQRQIES